MGLGTTLSQIRQSRRFVSIFSSLADTLKSIFNAISSLAWASHIEISNDCSFAGRVHHQKIFLALCRSQWTVWYPILWDRKSISKICLNLKIERKCSQKKGYRIFLTFGNTFWNWQGFHWMESNFHHPPRCEKTFLTLPDAKRLLTHKADENGDLRRIFNKAVPF